MSSSGTAWLRAILLATFALALWALAKYEGAMPPVLSESAPTTEFSAERAAAMLGHILGPEVPHPNSTEANVAVRGRILFELAKMGIPARTMNSAGCFGEKNFAMLECGTVTDIVAQVVPGKGKAVVMLAHYDSVPAGPGAADDGSGVATVLETARALRASHATSLHPVIALLTDGEEYGMLGAAAYLQNPKLRDDVGIALNIEARGNQGPSRLFQLSPNASSLIDLYAQTAPAYAASSLYAEIYRFLPNDTDLTVFLKDGIAGYNFAIADNLPHYHTPRDTLANLSRASLQDHGDNLLGLVRKLEQTPYAALTGHDEIYMDVMGRVLPRMPQSYALPLAILLLCIVAVAAILGGCAQGRDWLAGALILPAMIVGAVLAGWAMVLIAQAISGQPDPAYAHPLALRAALGFAVAGVTLAATRMAGAKAAAGGIWFVLAVLGVIVAAFLPGFSPYFLLPEAAAALFLSLAAREGMKSLAGQAALFAASGVALVVWLGLVAASETVMGLKLHPLFMVSAALGLATLVPLLADDRLPRAQGRYAVGGCFVAAIVAAIVAGFAPAFSVAAPQRLNLVYIDDARSGKTLWAADANAPLPRALKAVAPFSSSPEPPYAGAWKMAYLAPAPKLAGVMPSAQILANLRTPKGRRLTLRFSGGGADMMTLALPGKAGLQQVIVGGATFAVPAQWRSHEQNWVNCDSRDCARGTITLDLADTGALKLTLISRKNTLPPQGKRLAAARPDWAVPSGYGDGTMRIATLSVPAAK